MKNRLCIPSSLDLLVICLLYYACIFAGNLSIGKYVDLIHFESLGKISHIAMFVLVVYLCSPIRKFSFFSESAIVFSYYKSKPVLVYYLFSLLISFLLPYFSGDGYGVSYKYFIDASSLAFLMIVGLLIYSAYGFLFLFYMAIASFVYLLFFLVFGFIIEIPAFGFQARAFTYYRVGLFSSFLALFLFYYKYNWLAIIFVYLGAVFAFLTLSKAAIIAAVLGFVFYAVVQATWFSSKRAMLSLLLLLSAGLTFFSIRGDVLSKRVNEGVLGVGYSASSGVDYSKALELDLLRQDQFGVASVDSSVAILRREREAQVRIAKILACQDRFTVCSITDISPGESAIVEGMLRNYVYLPDFSVRIRLALHALDLIRVSPFLGNGFESYVFQATNLYSGEPELYFYPHNLILELIVLFGAVGLLLYFSPMLFYLYMILRDPIKVDRSLPFLSLFVAIFIGAMFGGDVSDFRLGWIALFFAYLAVLQSPIVSSAVK